ncbi:MAG TPA: transglycosylase SLT domain-containing protein [Candidatus Dormibacteraeota bacterium]|nr:transglycosylase SLT domain-containing protein [Candidatus Dormibacteraeota bacterium]
MTEGQRRPLPLIAGRLRWIAAGAFLLLVLPAIGVLTVGTAEAAPLPQGAKGLAHLAAAARNLVPVADFQVTLPPATSHARRTASHTVQILASSPATVAVLPLPAPPAGTIRPIIYAAAKRYGVSYSWLLSTAECESGLNPNAVNTSSGATGLFQFMPTTFYGHGGTDIWSPYQQANIAAQMFAAGESNQWTCA